MSDARFDGVSSDLLALTGADLLHRWNQGAPLGVSVAVTYSFSTAKPAYDTQARPGFAPLSAQQQAHARQALAGWADVGGIVLVEVPEAVGGQIRFALIDMTGLPNATGQQASGFAYYPQVSTTTVAGVTTRAVSYNNLGGDVYLNSAMYAGDDAALAPGQLRFFFEGPNIVVEINVDVGLTADMAILLARNINLGAIDFVL